MKNKFKYIIFVNVFLTGFLSLIYQVIWQKFISFYIGGQAKSAAMVVGLFLTGLALGNLYWGRKTLEMRERKKLLQTYGFVELGIGFYAIIFFVYIDFLSTLIFREGNGLFLELIFGLLIIFIPAFGMGATIPILTGILPESSEQINISHSKIYGLNALGAFCGVVIGSFYLMHAMDIRNLMSILALINIFVSLPFIFNQLKGGVERDDRYIKIESETSNNLLLFIIFCTGVISISLEMLLMRLLSLSIGSNIYIFGLVVGVFILCLSLGSLSLSQAKVDKDSLSKEFVKSTLGVGLIYITAPYWPNWISLFKIKYITNESDSYLYLLFMFGFLFLIIFPAVFSFGRLFPLAFSLLNKDKENYAKICGDFYFINSIGTLIGSIVFSFLLLYLFDIPVIMKSFILSMGLISCYMMSKQKSKKIYQSIFSTIVIALILTNWNRSSHHLGIYLLPSKVNLQKGWFDTPAGTEDYNLLFLKDGPDSTVSVLQKTVDHQNVKSIIVNGKSDSSTYGSDLSTTTMIATLPYLFTTKRSEYLSAAVVGLGTGVTSGVLTKLNDISQVDSIEISPFIIEAQKYFSNDNFNVMKNTKHNIIEDDAFRFFRKSQRKYDIIVSEPSNTWVVGNENLFTSTFYETVKGSMNKQSIFGQWIHHYDISKEDIVSILKNISQYFKNYQLYLTSPSDMLVLASDESINDLNIKRFHEEDLIKIHSKIGLIKSSYIGLIHLFNKEHIDFIIDDQKHYSHTMFHPILAKNSFKYLFSKNKLKPEVLFRANKARYLYDELAKQRSTFFHENSLDQEMSTTCHISKSFFCHRYYEIKKWHNQLQGNSSEYQRLEAYSLLRQIGYIQKDVNFLKQLTTEKDDRIKYHLTKELEYEGITKQ